MNTLQETPPSPSYKSRGLSLFSGGLDSILAVSLLKEQGCYIEAVTFVSPFFGAGSAKKWAGRLGVRLNIIDFTDDIVKLIDKPPHGFGGAMNPCIDCHAAMIRRAGELMREKGFDFVATGEVLNQRPMSQNRRSLSIVEGGAGLEGRLVRPLSALLLEETIPEKEGLIDRSKLMGIDGRNRRTQQELAAHFGITDYPGPAGGCLLTEKLFCRKLNDLKNNGLLFSKPELGLLRLGRHFRLPGGSKCIIGRNADENLRLQQAAEPNYIILHPVATPGPTMLLSATASDEDVSTATELCAAYSDTSANGLIHIRIRRPNADTEDKTVLPMSRETAKAWML